MRPYLAIIRDSFHAAFASRILWIVLVAIFVLLLALAPVGYQEVFTVDFSRGDINSTGRLNEFLTRALESTEDSAAQRVAKALPEEMQQKLRDAKTKEDVRPPGSSQYVEAFNELIKSDDWYDAQLWSKTLRLRELRELDELADDAISERLQQRRARLRIEAALPNAFRPRPNRSIQVTYGWLESPITLPLRQDQFADLLNQLVYPTVLNFLLGVGAVFVGVLVTSPIIPDMFQPGSLHLLLSKPISRPALYLSKFIGGCAFVFLCVSLLVAGLWLISGTRLDIWNYRLFYSIPVFVFLFAVYYSVSALAGLHWRSPVVSVAVTVVFWFLCFTVGTLSGIFDGFVADPARVLGIAIPKDNVLLATQSGSLFRVDAVNGKRTPLIEADFGQLPGRIPLAELPDGRIVVARSEGGFGRGGEKARLAIFLPSDEWKEVPGLELPNNTSRLIPTKDGGLLTVSLNGVYFAPGNALQVDLDAEDDKKPGGLLGGLQRFLGAASVKTSFQPALPATFNLLTPSAIVHVEKTGDLVVYSAGTLHRFNRPANPEPPATSTTWMEAVSTEVEGDNSLAVQLAATSQHIVVARKSEPLRIYNTEDLSLLKEITVDDTYAILGMKASPDEQYALAILSNKSLLKIELTEEPSAALAKLPFQNDIETFGWSEDNRLWLVHAIDRIEIIDSANGNNGQLIPERDLWRQIYAWVITPLRNVTPQTGEVGEIVIAAICGRSNIELFVGDGVERQQLSIVRPLATCGGFAVLMLLLGCFYVYRQDF